MRSDPKFGWHTVYILPAFLVLTGVDAILSKYKDWKHDRYISRALKNQDIKDLSDLAGTKHGTNKSK